MTVSRTSAPPRPPRRAGGEGAMETAINLLERRGALVPPKMALGQQQAARKGSAAR